MSDSYNHPGLLRAHRKRHPASGGYASGRRTRTRIISAALRVFGEHGYDRAATRQIAEHAGVNTPAIQYYFGGKQGLHAACTRHVIGRVSSLLALPLARAGDALRNAKPAVALDALCDLLVAVVDGLLIGGSENWSRYYLTCLARDGDKPADGMFHENIGARLFDTMSRLIAAAANDSSGSKLTRLRACLLLGQVSSLYQNRAHTLAVMDWSHFDAHALALIKSVICEHARGALATSRASATQTEPHHRSPGWAQPGG
jgi:TetR/AcrR family transcriptional regulator, regulator of cefoperazone and chloramphenicol sensitivity